MEFEEAYYYFSVVLGYKRQDTASMEWDFVGADEKFYEPMRLGLKKKLGKTEAGCRFCRFDALGILINANPEKFIVKPFVEWARSFVKADDNVFAGLRVVKV